MEEVLPVGSVDQGAFGLLADATRYVLVEEEEGEVHLRAETAALGEVVASLARAGTAVKPADAQKAVARFAALWEAKARHRGTWEGAVAQARADGELRAARPPKPGRSLWEKLRGLRR